ncbi:dihydrofolate reductase [Rhizobium sp. MHM7A]|uniref:dihydrofolate reductase n=1 Tax=Rhizobium sp. MHM7A TaxID=2583233 RepID=UPI001105A1B4|nr:dihydrofolate reductase [Rhizobium sp. MHM7A]TLX17053.1 dihydrofolate reductase [Rhizobium sp. MHM7A]
MKLTMIAACDRAWGIGRANSLGWHEPADLAHFKQRTMGQHLIMGRRTFESLPTTLRGRTIHVLSRSEDGNGLNIQAAIEVGHDNGLSEMLVAGGGEIYRQLEPFCSHAEITRIPGQFNCDTFMPNLSELGWRLFAEKLLTPTLIIEFWRKV